METSRSLYLHQIIILIFKESMTYQKTIIIGNLGHAPSLKNLDNNVTLCEFSVAVTEKIKGQDETTWYSVTVFGKQAEACKNYLNKGSQVYCEGKPKVEQYEGKDGTTKYKIKLTADVVKFIGTKSEKKEEGVVKENFTAEPSIRIDQLASSQTVTGSGFSADSDDDSEEIPF